MNNVIYIDPIYIKYRKMWKEDRWKFSSDMVKLSIKRSKSELSNEEQHIMNILDRVVNENNNDWLDDQKPNLFKRRISPN